MYLLFQLKKNNFFKSRHKNLLFNFRSILTLKRPGYSDPGMAGERQGWNLPPSVASLFK